jgi:hypothetical protein
VKLTTHLQLLSKIKNTRIYISIALIERNINYCELLYPTPIQSDRYSMQKADSWTCSVLFLQDRSLRRLIASKEGIHVLAEGCMRFVLDDKIIMNLITASESLVGSCIPHTHEVLTLLSSVCFAFVWF